MTICTAWLSPKIDLTESRDFRPRIVPIDYLNSPDENELMSTDECVRIARRESIFGKKIHRNRRDVVFDREGKFMDEVSTHCERCGKEFRIPWKFRWGLCEKCIEELGEPSQIRIPWIPGVGAVSDIRQDTKYNLFNSR